MPSFRSATLAITAAFVAVARADYWVDPESVPLSTRKQWCDNEKYTCPLICQQTEPRTTLVNTCDPDNLKYGCLCGDNKRPNVSEYSLTLPYFICQEWGNQCVTGCNGDNTCASSCREDNPCGAQDPTRVKVKATSSATTADTATATDDSDDLTTVYTGRPGTNSNDDDDSDDDSSDTVGTGAGAALHVGSAYGLAIVLGSLFAGFSML